MKRTSIFALNFILAVVLSGGCLLAADNGRTFLAPHGNLEWVADASHFVSSGLSSRATLPRVEAQRLVAAMNAGETENFGHNNWRLASDFELGRLYQAQAAGELQASIRNLATFENWMQARLAPAVRGWARTGPRVDTVFAWPVRAASLAPEGFSDVAVFATNSVKINRATHVTGDVVANNVLSGPALDPGYSVSLQRLASVTGDVKGDTVVLNRDSSVWDPDNPTMPGTVFYNQLTNFGATPPPNKVTPLGLPVFAETPLFQPAVVRPEATDVVVGAGASVILDAGTYRDVLIAKTGVLVLSGGVYNFRSVAPSSTSGGQCPFPCRSIQFAGPVDIRIEGRFNIGADASVAPQAGFSASQAIFYVGGPNGGDGTSTALPSAFAVGQGGTLKANVYAPNGTIRIDQACTVEGGLFGRDVHIERDSTVTLNSFYANQPPTADPQTVVTTGSPVVITLTGSDPEGQDLAFSLVSGPSVGTLGPIAPIVPDPVPNPDDPDCANFDPMNPDPNCETSQPPVVSATATYTPVPDPDPMAEGDLQDSFTFAVTDPGGLTGMAVVSINPPGDPSDGGTPVETVVAIDSAAETIIDIPIPILLEADAPEGTVLTFSIEAPLPMGTLVDSDNMTVGAPRVVPSPNLTYTPPVGFTGMDVINFSVTGEVDSVPVTDFGVFTVTVLTGFELAPDQNVVTAVNTPILVTLTANSGGIAPSGAQPNGYKLAARAPRFGPLAGFVNPPAAEIAGNVSDANGDGLGDGRDDLPGPAPVLVAAGVDVNLGATPSGSVTDPAGDATNSPSDDPANPDLVSASVGASGGNLNMSIRFVASGFSSATSRGSFVLDTDENPATGFPGVDAANNDSALMGVEYLVDIGADLGANAEVLKFVSLPNNFMSVGIFPATVLSDGYDVSIPLTAFDGDDGRMTFKAETQSFLGSGYTGILDYAPDLGLAPGQSTAGVQGVARVQIEWDIPSLGVTSSSQVVSASVLLQTVKGTVDSLNTLFFVGTEDQNGQLDVSDFQAPASVLDGVIMPVPRSAPVGAEGTFAFDVTNAFKAAVDNPDIDFFSVQGRVDESLAGQGFKRGLQIRSTADSNLNNNLAPMLNVLTVGAGEPPQTAPLVWRVTSLPTGTLRDSAGNLVTTGQVFLSQPTLLFIPDSGFEASTSIGFTVEQGSIIDSGLINIVVTSVGNCEDNEVFCDDGRP